MSRPGRTLTLLDCVGIGINGIVGSGIYLLLSGLAGRAGNASVLGIFACGVLCILIALCFAECGGIFDRNGGPYVYARAAFGPYVGFAVGWMSIATGVFAFAAVARAFATALSALWPGLSPPLFQLGSVAVTGETLAAVLLIGALGAINYLGVKAGARTSDLLSFAKLAPLLVLAVVGLFFIRAEVVTGIFSSAPGATQGYWGGVASAAFLAVFMLSGFEFVSVPAGEAQQARRNIPIAIVGSLLGATLLYCLLQTVALSVVPDLGSPQRTQPLIDTAAAVFGEGARRVFILAALISMAGFCAGSALVGPRLFSALAEDGYLPRALTGTSRHGTPGQAILVATSLSMVLAVVLGFASLVDVSNVALFAQYIPTCLAVLVLRRRMPDAERAYRLPGGPVLPLLAVGSSVILLYAAQTQAAEWIFSGQVLLIGAAVWGLTVLVRRVGGSKPAPVPPGS